MQNRIAEAKSELQAAREEEESTSNIYSRPNAGPEAAGRRGRGGYGKAAVLSAASDSDEPSIEELEQAVAKAERDYEQLHDQARQAGVPPGWLR